MVIKPPEKIKIIEVIGLLEDPFAPVKCVTDLAAYKLYEFCITHDIWSELQKNCERSKTK